MQSDAGFTALAQLFLAHSNSVPSDHVDLVAAEQHATRVLGRFNERRIGKFGVRVHGAGEYPARLRDAEYPIELLYYRGDWTLADIPRAVAVVGTRNPS